MDKESLHIIALDLLKDLIALPAFSKEENNTADLLQVFFEKQLIKTQRHLNNVWAANKYFDDSKPTLLLNSHHDTVKPNQAYTKNPFEPSISEGKLYGLGSNDAGGSLVSLIAVFLFFYDRKDLKYNIMLSATAEEEISGMNGIVSILNQLPLIDSAIVGEPTQMQLAIAERGLMVLDCISKGKAGHAAREEGENAIDKAMKDVEWINSFQFEKKSVLLGAVKMTVTSIETENKTHNIIPSECRFVIDVRVNELYNLEEVLETIRNHIQSEVHPRSMRLKSSFISLDHPLVRSGLAQNLKHYGSPTTSDKALMPFPALKIGPGDSARSHTADEYIFINEIGEGIELYLKILNGYLF